MQKIPKRPRFLLSLPHKRGPGCQVAGCNGRGDGQGWFPPKQWLCSPLFPLSIRGASIMFYAFLVLLSGVELRTFAFISAQQNSEQPKLMQSLEVGLMYSEHIWLTLPQQTGGTASLLRWEAGHSPTAFVNASKASS